MNPRLKKSYPRRSAARHAAAQQESAGEMEAQELQERLLAQIAQGGKLCQEVEGELSQHRCPELETIIKLHRVLVLRLSGEAEAIPDHFKLVSSLMKPLMEWAQLEERRKQRELAEQKYRDELAAQQAAAQAQESLKVLTPQTLERIERELKLF